jgi:hypothetical protein
MLLTDVCLCLSALPLFMETNAVAMLVADVLGTQAITDLLTSLVRRMCHRTLEMCPDIVSFQILGAAPSNCNYPDHSTPACINGNPCGFTCTDSYTASPPEDPTTCVCATPNVLCNGICTTSGSACPSSQATIKKRWIGSGSCTERGLGWAACGVFGGGARAWECVNTARDLESCEYPWHA